MINADFRPTWEELRRTGLYFRELEDALSHYASPLPQGQFFTVTERSDPQGGSKREIVRETRFPSLDELSEHFNKLKYAAWLLDKLPPSFWEKIYQGHLCGDRTEFGYFPMQITLWGAENKEQNNFARQADLYELFLRGLSWSEPDKQPDHYRDFAEQCFRIVNAYLKLHSHIKAGR